MRCGEQQYSLHYELPIGAIVAGGLVAKGVETISAYRREKIREIVG